MRVNQSILYLSAVAELFSVYVYILPVCLLDYFCVCYVSNVLNISVMMRVHYAR